MYELLTDCGENIIGDAHTALQNHNNKTDMKNHPIINKKFTQMSPQKSYNWRKL